MKYQNKWSEISKFIKGRSENAVKNRFNILMKRHKQSDTLEKIVGLDRALEAINESQKDELAWIYKLIDELKKENSDKTPQNMPQSNEDEKFPTTVMHEEKQTDEKMIEKVIESASSITLEEAKKSPKVKIDNDFKVFVNPGAYTCPNLRFIERARIRDVEIIKTGTKFVNPETLQEIYLTPYGSFIREPSGCIFP